MGFIVELIKTRSIGEKIDDCITLASRIVERRKKILTSFGRRRINPPFKLIFFQEELERIKKNLPWKGGMVDIHDCFLLFNESIIPAQNYPISKIVYLSETL